MWIGSELNHLCASANEEPGPLVNNAPSHNFRWCDQHWRNAFCRSSAPDEGDNPTELEGKWRVDGTWIDPKLLSEGRQEEMEYMRKMGVFEVVDEKECHDNGCEPLKLK